MGRVLKGRKVVETTVPWT